jgi:hypothetical protein
LTVPRSGWTILQDGALSGIAKDLNKMSEKFDQLLVPSQQGTFSQM